MLQLKYPIKTQFLIHYLVVMTQTFKLWYFFKDICSYLQSLHILTFLFHINENAEDMTAL